jgi:hypothetical protein
MDERRLREMWKRSRLWGNLTQGGLCEECEYEGEE